MIRQGELKRTFLLIDRRILVVQFYSKIQKPKRAEGNISNRRNFDWVLEIYK